MSSNKNKSSPVANEDESSVLVPNVGKTDIQRAFKMTDELFNHSVMVLEEHDAEMEPPNNEKA